MLTSLTSAIASVLVAASTIVPVADNHVTVTEPFQSVGIPVYARIIDSTPDPEPEPELISLDIKW